jgi:serine/threonine-protein kinase
MTGPHQGETRQFDGHDTLLVGRADNAQLRLPEDRHFSRNHFRVEVKPPECHLVDLESSNGTYVNGRRVSDIWLKDGDTISGGQTEIRVRVEGVQDNAATQMFQLGSDPLAETMLGPSPDALQTIVNYDIVREIGRGSMGVVYHATDQTSRKDVALKLIQPGMQLSEMTIQTFLREGKVLKQLRHKRIVRFVETGVVDGRLFLAMEYVDAVDIDKTLAELKLNDRIRVACGLARQVLDGLGYAHKLDLVHRDVKPKNILVAKRAGGLSAKIADFGLAKNFMDAGMSQISGENEIKGTLCFMPPEQVVSCRYAKPQADIFAVGATLYTLISGKMIYDLDDHSTPLAAVLNSGPIPISKRVRVPPELAAVITKSLAHEAEDRYQTAEEMRLALEPFCM